jgi:hypothetical protein
MSNCTHAATVDLDVHADPPVGGRQPGLPGTA